MKKVVSSVSGRVISIGASIGGQVQPGDELFKVESMKMEIPIEAEESGGVVQILVKEGDEVQEGQEMAILE